MAKKYYAVRKGFKIGVFDTWEECKKSIDGYSGSEYKGFASLNDAENYLDPLLGSSAEIQDVILNDSVINNPKEKGNEIRSVIAYVDGSFSEDIGAYSFGCVILAGDKIERLSGSNIDQSAVTMRNVAGELLGAMTAIKWAYENKYSKIIIFHDYEGIAKWITGEWKAKQEATKKYIEFVTKYKKYIDIGFSKVAAHTGVIYNEEADILAKEALNRINIVNRLSTSVKDATYEYAKIFDKVMKTKAHTKNQCIIKLKGYELSERKLLKFVKEVWKSEGNDIEIIDSIQISVETNSCTINWSIKDKLGKVKDAEFSI
jgi:ribonuclease HI